MSNLTKIDPPPQKKNQPRVIKNTVGSNTPWFTFKQEYILYTIIVDIVNIPFLTIAKLF